MSAVSSRSWLGLGLEDDELIDIFQKNRISVTGKKRFNI